MSHVTEVDASSLLIGHAESHHLPYGKCYSEEMNRLFPKAHKPKMQKEVTNVQVNLSDMPSEVEKTAKKVSAWSVIWRVILSLPLLGAWGWAHLYNTVKDPDSRLIHSLESPINQTFAVGSSQEVFFDSTTKEPLISYEINTREKKSVKFPDGSVQVIREIDELLEKGFRGYQLLDVHGRDIDQYQEVRALNVGNDDSNIKPFIQNHPYIKQIEKEAVLKELAERGMVAVYDYDGRVEEGYIGRLPKGEESSMEDYIAAYQGGINPQTFAQGVERIFKQYESSRDRYYAVIDLLKIEPAFVVFKEARTSELVQFRARAFAEWAGAVSGASAIGTMSTSNPVSVLQAMLKNHLRHPFSEEENAIFASVVRGGGHSHPIDRDSMQIQLLPSRQEDNGTVYPVHVTWKFKVDFSDGTSNTYVINQDVEILRKGDNQPCEVTIRRFTNAPARS